MYGLRGFNLDTRVFWGALLESVIVFAASCLTAAEKVKNDGEELKPALGPAHAMHQCASHNDLRSIDH